MDNNNNKKTKSTPVVYESPNPAAGITERSIIVCKDCKHTVVRILSGKYPNARDKRWVDTYGRCFNGAVCPKCHSTRVAKKNAEKRLEMESRKEYRETLAQMVPPVDETPEAAEQRKEELAKMIHEDKMARLKSEMLRLERSADVEKVDLEEVFNKGYAVAHVKT